MDEAVLLALVVILIVVLLFQAYLWILLARLMKALCRYLDTKTYYYSSSILEDEN